MRDVLVVGAGPAGALAAWRLASAGARVTIVDRDAFPRDKLCGDTLNPGAVAFLESLGIQQSPLPAARPLAGMTVSGPRTRIDARYPAGVTGRAILRRHFDAWLLNQAVAAGAQFESGLMARRRRCRARGRRGRRPRRHDGPGIVERVQARGLRHYCGRWTGIARGAVDGSCPASVSAKALGVRHVHARRHRHRRFRRDARAGPAIHRHRAHRRGCLQRLRRHRARTRVAGPRRRS